MTIDTALESASPIQRGRFAGKVCLITGGGSGIGRATSKRFAAEGARVAVVDCNVATACHTVQEIVEGHGEAIYVKADVSSSADVQAAIATAVARWGYLDVVVNDAATMTFDSIVDLPEEDWDRVMNVNLRSVFLFCKYATPHMRPGGAFINISSVHAHGTTRNVVPYATSKGGVEAFTRGFSGEIADLRLRINSVAPGAIDTPMLWNNPNIKSGAEKLEGAVGKPEDIAAAIAFLAGDEASFITGTTLVVDNGRLAGL